MLNHALQRRATITVRTGFRHSASRNPIGVACILNRNFSMAEKFTGETVAAPEELDVTRKPTSSLTIATPPRCLADFCLIPLGTPTASVSKEVAEVQRIVKKSGLEYTMHSAGTTLGSEGSWDDCMRVIGQCHALLHENGVLRIQSDIRVGTRTDKIQGFKDKVRVVEELLAKDKQ